MKTSKLTIKGQATIPKPVRDFLQIGSGDQLGFITEEDGHGFRRAVLIPMTVKAADLYGILKPPSGKPPLGLEDMERAIEETLLEDDLRIRRQCPGKGDGGEAGSEYPKAAEPAAGFQSE